MSKRDKPGRSRKIRRIVERRGSILSAGHDPIEFVEGLKQELRGKDRKKILDAALVKYSESEQLKPYQAELIRMQAHLEKTGRNRLLKKTHTRKNPWFVIRSDEKHQARINTMKLILTRVKYRGRSRTLDFSLDPDIVFTGTRELRRMEIERTKQGTFLS